MRSTLTAVLPPLPAIVAAVQAVRAKSEVKEARCFMANLWGTGEKERV
jgi:hypothetical protein